jgi:hypothetical protein
MAAAAVLRPETIDAAVTYFTAEELDEFLPGSVCIDA